jgi:thiol-disulfide isomerase/thioredoxin
VKRRSLAVVGGLATAAGIAGGLWFERRRGAAGPGTSATDASDTTVGQRFWSLQLPQPDGGELVMAHISAPQVIVNFWAPWCVPCVREMPTLDRFHRAYAARGWPVVGLAIDTPQPVTQFLQKVPVSFAVALVGAPGLTLGKDLGNEAGGLPFTVAIHKSGRVLHRKVGETHFDELVAWTGLK